MESLKPPVAAPRAGLSPPPRDRSLDWMGGLLCAGVLLSAVGFSWWFIREPAAAPEPRDCAVAGLGCPTPGAAPNKSLAPSVEPLDALEIAQPAPRRPQRPTPDFEAVRQAEEFTTQKPTIASAAAEAEVSPTAPAAGPRDLIAAEAVFDPKAKPAAKGPPTWTEAQLLEMLRRAPTVGLEAAAAKRAFQTAAEEAAVHGKAARPDISLQAMVQAQPNLKGLPFRGGADSLLEAEPAKILNSLSPQLRSLLQAVSRTVRTMLPPQQRRAIQAPSLRQALLTRAAPVFDAEVNYDAARLNVLAGNWRQPAAVPTLNQLLMGEDAAPRGTLIELLAQIDGPQASAALAQRALFDTSAPNRAKAIAALRMRPPAEVRPTLLEGLRHPWLPANYHAAAALIQLQDTEALPALEKLLNEPDPREPAATDRGIVRRELVRVNHNLNCVLCHAPSLDPQDLVRKAVTAKVVDRPVRIRLAGKRLLPNGTAVDHRLTVLGHTSGDVTAVFGVSADAELISLRPELQLSMAALGEPAGGGSGSYGASGGAPAAASATPMFAAPALFFGPGMRPLAPPPLNPIQRPISDTATTTLGPPEVRFRDTDSFIRADVTYLKQDFSLQFSSLHLALPQTERFDFLVRERPLTPEEYAERLTANPTGHKHIKRHEAVLYALERLNQQKGEGGRRPERVFAAAAQPVAPQEPLRRAERPSATDGAPGLE